METKVADVARVPVIRRKRVSVGFSLVEMIVVVGIVATLLALGAGMFRRSGAEAVRTGVEKFAGMVEQARTSAITRRKPVALVLVSPGQAGLGDDECRLGLFELESWEAGEPLTGTQIKRWEGLPGGLGFRPGKFESLGNVMDEDRVTLTWRKGQQSAELPMLVFSPRGGLLSPSGSQPTVVVIASGVHQKGQFIPREGEGWRAIRIGRVVARPWILDV